MGPPDREDFQAPEAQEGKMASRVIQEHRAPKDQWSVLISGDVYRQFSFVTNQGEVGDPGLRGETGSQGRHVCSDTYRSALVNPPSPFVSLFAG